MLTVIARRARAFSVEAVRCNGDARNERVIIGILDNRT